jgi:hypothetical protein
LEASTDGLTSRTKRQTFSEDERRIAGVSSVFLIATDAGQSKNSFYQTGATINAIGGTDFMSLVLKRLFSLKMGWSFYLDERECPASPPGRTYTWERTHSNHWIGGCVGLRAVWTQRLEGKLFASAGD